MWRRWWRHAHMLASACLLAVERSRFVDVLASRRLSTQALCPASTAQHARVQWLREAEGQVCRWSMLSGRGLTNERTDARETPAKRRLPEQPTGTWAFTGLPAVTRSELIVNY